MLSGGQSVRPARHIARGRRDLEALRAAGLLKEPAPVARSPQRMRASKGKENSGPPPLYFAWKGHSEMPEGWHAPDSYFHWNEEEDLASMFCGAKTVGLKDVSNKKAAPASVPRRRGRRTLTCPRSESWWPEEVPEEAPKPAAEAAVQPLVPPEMEQKFMEDSDLDAVAAATAAIGDDDGELVGPAGIDEFEGELGESTAPFPDDEDPIADVPLEEEYDDEEDFADAIDLGTDLEVVGTKIEDPTLEVVGTKIEDPSSLHEPDEMFEADDEVIIGTDADDEGDDNADLAKIMKPVDRALERVRRRRSEAATRRLENLQRLAEAPTPADRIRERRRRLTRPWKIQKGSKAPRPKPFFGGSPLTYAPRYVDPPTPRDRSRRSTTYTRSYAWR